MGTAPSPVIIQELRGRFRVLAELGQGGSSHVWLAVARGPSGFSKLVVLKSMKGELTSEPELAQMFLNEAKLAARLNHPNIVQTNEVFENEGRPVIVMEYLDGQSLAAVLARHRQSNGFALPLQLRVLSEALGGLHAAHELTDFDGRRLEVVHRDVSPHNIFISYDGQTKVIDFGIAKLAGLAEATESGVIRGKLHYMSPEQITAGVVDRRADIYAAGVLLWEMVAGVRMWRGVNEAVVMNRVLSGKLPELGAINAAVEPRLIEIAAQATALDPRDRHRSAADFQLDLDEYLAATSPQLRPRDLAFAVTKLFADRRSERQQIVETELARVMAQTDQEHASYEPITLPILELQAENLTQLHRRRRLDRSRRAAPWLLSALLCVGLAAALVRLNSAAPVAPATTPVITPLPADPKGEPHGGTTTVVRLRVTAFPGEAELSFDGSGLLSNPYLGSYRRELSVRHELVATANGYQSAHRTIMLDQDQDLVLTLLPVANEGIAPAKRAPKIAASMAPPEAPVAALPEAPLTSPSPAPAVTPEPTAPAVVSAPGPSHCDPPYYFDVRGVKKYKPGCL